jgi:PAS domain S-box-containing protein
MSTSTKITPLSSDIEAANSLNLKLHHTIDNAMEGIALLDAEGRYEYVNKLHVVMFGYESSEEMIGASWKMIYAEPEIATIQDKIFPLLMQQGFWRGEIDGKSRDGMPVSQEVSLTMLPGGGLACFCRDVSDKKRRHQQFKRLAIVAEKTNSIVLIMNSEKQVTWINDSFEKRFGLHSDNVVGYNPAELLKPFGKNSSSFVSNLMQTLDSCGKFSGEMKVSTKDHTRIWLFIEITAIYSDVNVTTGYIAVMNDITLIKKAEILLQRSIEKERMLNRLKTQFISLASHQFRTPLATLRSSIDLLDLKLDTKNPEEFITLFWRYKHVLFREIERMSELMENILDISRMEEEKIQLKKCRSSLQTFMTEFVASCQEPGPEGRSLLYRNDAPEDEINIDPVLIRNALRNIISNAYKYSLGRCPPELTVSLCNDKFHITVKDYGIGIPEMEQPLLFTSFFRAHNTKHLPGCGLGLMISKRLIEAHGGEINIKSEDGAGCQVTIMLPR